MSRRTWIIVLVAACLLFAISTFLMVERESHQELWGHLPLFQFTAFWVMSLMLIMWKSLTAPSIFKTYLLATLSALLLSLGFPPFPFPFLLFIGFVPLLYALDISSGDRSKNTFFLLFHTFLLWNIWSTYWVANTAYAAGIFANVVNAGLMCIPVMIHLFIRKKLGKSVALVAFITTWIAFEFLHMRWDLYWPWLTLGNGLSSMHFGIQWYGVTGVLGGSIWILLINFMVYKFWINGREFGMIRLWPLACVILLPLLVSLMIYQSYQESGEKIEVVAVQPNLEPHYEESTYSKEAIVSRFIQLSQQQLTDSTDFLLFPETSFTGINMDRPLENDQLKSLQRFLLEYPNVALITGLSGYRILTDPDEQVLSTTRLIPRRDGDLFVESYNCAIQMDASGNLLEYYKVLYVPGAEFFPFQRFLFFLKPIVDQLGGTIEGYRVKTKYGVFGTEDVKIAPSICYESIFGEYMSYFIRKGTQAIFIMTNDGWWDNTAGHKQHAAFARLRAIECRRSIARSANMGTCGFINQRGDFSQATSYGEINSIRGEIALNDKITFYSRWGDFLGRISCFIAGLLFLRSMVKKIMPG